MSSRLAAAERDLEIDELDMDGATRHAGEIGRDETAMAILTGHPLHDKPGARTVSVGLQKHMHLVDDLTVAQGRELKEAFESFDTNGSGFLELGELAPLMRSLGADLTPEELEDYVRMIDTDRDTRIDLREFLIMMAMKIQYPFSVEDLHDSFYSLMGDRDGKIDRMCRDALGGEGEGVEHVAELDVIPVSVLQGEVLAAVDNDLQRSMAEEMIRDACEFRTNGGHIDFKRFTEHLFSVR
jgi:Ca2+-binding EF-hand superfamily protein